MGCYIDVYECKECKSKFCLHEYKTADFRTCPSCHSAGTVTKIERESKFCGSPEDEAKFIEDFEKKERVRKEKAREESARKRAEIANPAPVRTKKEARFWTVAFCKECNKYYVITDLERLCKNKNEKHLIEDEDRIARFDYAEAGSWKRAQKLRDEREAEKTPAPGQKRAVCELRFNRRFYGLGEIRELHNDVYVNFRIDRFFKAGKIFDYDEEYAAFLDEYFCEEQLAKERKLEDFDMARLEKRRAEITEQSRRQRARLLTEINAVEDESERFFYYCHRSGHISPKRLAWRFESGCVGFDCVEEFIDEYLGTKRIFWLTAEEKERLLNKYTFMYFFFCEDREQIESGDFDRELRLQHLLLKHRGRLLGFGTAAQFRDGLINFDGDIMKREELLRKLKYPASDAVLAAEVLRGVRGEGFCESYGAIELEEGSILREDAEYLPEIKNCAFVNYLGLCLEWAAINSFSKINILGLEIPLDITTAEGVVRKLVCEAYLNQFNVTGGANAKALRRFAILKLAIKAQVFSLSPVFSPIGFFEKLEKCLEGDTYAECLRKAYFLCSEGGKERLRLVEPTGAAKSLPELLSAAMDNSDSALLMLWESEAVKDLLSEILGEGLPQGFDRAIEGAEKVIKSTDDALRAMKNEMSNVPADITATEKTPKAGATEKKRPRRIVENPKKPS